MPHSRAVRSDHQGLCIDACSNTMAQRRAFGNVLFWWQSCRVPYGKPARSCWSAPAPTKRQASPSFRSLPAFLTGVSRLMLIIRHHWLRGRDGDIGSMCQRIGLGQKPSVRHWLELAVSQHHTRFLVEAWLDHMCKDSTTPCGVQRSEGVRPPSHDAEKRQYGGVERCRRCRLWCRGMPRHARHPPLRGSRRDVQRGRVCGERAPSSHICKAGSRRVLARVIQVSVDRIGRVPPRPAWRSACSPERRQQLDPGRCSGARRMNATGRVGTSRRVGGATPADMAQLAHPAPVCLHSMPSSATAL